MNFKDYFMDESNYTIKDIARISGVSIGTVDRVLHHRGNVSEEKLARVQKVLDEIHYQPNVFAIGLAAKKQYKLACLLPQFEEGDYWSEVYCGVLRAANEVRPFNVSINFYLYVYGNRESFVQTCASVVFDETDALLIAPGPEKCTLSFCQRLHEKKIPFAFIDFNIPQANPLCYIGQDSKESGYLTAKILTHNHSISEDDELLLVFTEGGDNSVDLQRKNRFEGFLKFLKEKKDRMVIHEVALSKTDAVSNERILDNFFDMYPKALYVAAFNSRIYLIGNYLKKKNKGLKGLIGFDLLDKNVELLKGGVVDSLIAQRPGTQAYRGIKVLCDYIVFKKEVPAVIHMPIDILYKENVDYYYEFI